MEFLIEYGLFLAKAITIVLAILIVVGGIASVAMRQKKSSDKQLAVTHIGNQFEEMEKTVSTAALSPDAVKQRNKAEKKRLKQEARAQKKAHKASKKSNDPPATKKRVFVINFNGDIKASSVENMRQEISAVLTCATTNDEVLVRLESGGGTVHGYGLGASQLQRIREREIPLTVSVDMVAASGGYMMACVANKIIAAPFSIIGSIGVLAQIPNLHRFLKKHDVDFEQLYAGEYKRTLTLFGENTSKGRTKVQQDLEETHQLFKDFVKSQRPGLDIDKVATGEHWLGIRAQELGLVDELQTSDDYLMARRRKSELLLVEYSRKKSLSEKLTSLMSIMWRKNSREIQDMDKPLLM